MNIGTAGEDRDINTLRSRGKESGTGTLNTCSPGKVVYYRRTGTGVPYLKLYWNFGVYSMEKHGVGRIRSLMVAKRAR